MVGGHGLIYIAVSKPRAVLRRFLFCLRSILFAASFFLPGTSTGGSFFSFIFPTT